MKLVNNNHPLNSAFGNWFFDDLFTKDTFRSHQPNAKERGHHPPKANISENAETFTIELAVPGMTKEDIIVDITDRKLTVSSTKEMKADEDKTFSRKEFSIASFRRAFSLPKNANQDKISAEYAQGILTLQIPKVEEIKKTLQIEVK